MASSTQDAIPTGMAFSSDGARMFVVGSTGDAVNEYTLSSAYPIRVTDSVPPTLVSSALDIATGALTMAFSEAIDAASVVHSKMHVRESGTYEGRRDPDRRRAWHRCRCGSTISFALTPAHLEAVRGLATPELTIEPGGRAGQRSGTPSPAPLTSPPPHSSIRSPSRHRTWPQTGVAFSNDGAKMFVVGWFEGDAVREYALSAPFDVSTASFVDSFDVSSQDAQPVRHGILKRRRQDVRGR